jgi:hypothetical protein
VPSVPHRAKHDRRARDGTRGGLNCSALGGERLHRRGADPGKLHGGDRCTPSVYTHTSGTDVCHQKGRANPNCVKLSCRGAGEGRTKPSCRGRAKPHYRGKLGAHQACRRIHVKDNQATGRRRGAHPARFHSNTTAGACREMKAAPEAGGEGLNLQHQAVALLCFCF